MTIKNFTEKDIMHMKEDIYIEMAQIKEMLDSTLSDYEEILSGKLKDVGDVEEVLFTRLDDAQAGIDIIKDAIRTLEYSDARRDYMTKKRYEQMMAKQKEWMDHYSKDGVPN